jgi:hypothetical protein
MAGAKLPGRQDEQKNSPRVRNLTLVGGIAYLSVGVVLWRALDAYIATDQSMEKQHLVQALALMMAGVAVIIAIGYCAWRLRQLESWLNQPPQEETQNTREQQDIAYPAPAMPMNDKEVEHIWNFYIELGLMERHFNEIGSGYRRLASTWLLAAFAAIGFVLSTELALQIPPELIIAALGLAGGVGVFLIWVLDLLVNQRLLDASFSQCRALEGTHKWLPQVRNNMRALLRGKGLTLLLWFYIAGTEVMAFVGGVGLLLWLYTTPTLGVIVYLIAIDHVLGMVLVLMLMRVKTSVTPYREKQIWDSRGGSGDGDH